MCEVATPTFRSPGGGLSLRERGLLQRVALIGPAGPTGVRLEYQLEDFNEALAAILDQAALTTLGVDFLEVELGEILSEDIGIRSVGSGMQLLDVMVTWRDGSEHLVRTDYEEPFAQYLVLRDRLKTREPV